MTRRKRILSIVAAFIAVALLSLALVLSHNSACGAPPALAEGAQRMKAVIYRCYGPSEVLQVEEIAKPVPEDDQVLVKVHAAAMNPLDWHYMRGTPYFMRLTAGLGTPNDSRMGVDFAGTVEAVGKSVTRFKPGDEVFGGRGGAFGEYVAVRAHRALMIKPANVTFEQAAAVPVAAITALQGLRDHGAIKPGHKVLINGASGGVGTFAVQIAKHLGAEVTGVCSTRNVELVRSLGADHVIDYTQQDFTQGGEQYDVILDNVGNRSLSEYRRVLKPDGKLLINSGGGPADDPWIGPMGRPLKAAVLSPFVSEQLFMFLAELNQKDLEILSGLMQSGKLTSVIDRRYPLGEIRAAMEYIESGRARGKVIVKVIEEGATARAENTSAGFIK